LDPAFLPSLGWQALILKPQWSSASSTQSTTLTFTSSCLLDPVAQCWDFKETRYNVVDCWINVLCLLWMILPTQFCSLFLSLLEHTVALRPMFYWFC
jgi:hypothetical protein